MITMETAVAAIVTFILGMAFGAWLTTLSIRYALRTDFGRKVYREILEKAERHATHEVA
jgi:hypothetical protein